MVISHISKIPGSRVQSNMFSGAFGNSAQPPPATPDIGGNLLAEGIDQIREHDRNFDPGIFYRGGLRRFL